MAECSQIVLTKATTPNSLD